MAVAAGLAVMLWGYVITGAVGIAGTALGSWLTGRTQTNNLRLNIDAENKRAQTAEKRRIYASCVAGLDAGYTGVLTEINYRSKPSTPAKIAAIQEREASFLKTLNTVAELELVASKEVVNLAGKILTMLGNLDEINPDDFRSLRSDLHKAMRADLGVPD